MYQNFFDAYVFERDNPSKEAMPATTQSSLCQQGGVKGQNIIFHLSLFSLHGFDPSKVTTVLATGQDIMNPKVVRQHKGREKRLQSAGDLEGFP